MIVINKNTIKCVERFSILNLPPRSYRCNINKYKLGGQVFNCDKIINSWVFQASIVKNTSLLETIIQSCCYCVGSKLEFSNINNSKLDGVVAEHIFSNYSNLQDSNLYNATLEFSKIFNCHLDNINVKNSSLSFINCLSNNLESINLVNCDLNNCTISGFGTIDGIKVANATITVKGKDLWVY